ncbi:hypothetical protein F4680DRAFT_223426 [Xylaria scruposa]|nr:hypothetical protein F4680DRAFT_223426 [Xylaria scruposa]
MTRYDIRKFALEPCLELHLHFTYLPYFTCRPRYPPPPPNQQLIISNKQQQQHRVSPSPEPSYLFLFFYPGLFLSSLSLSIINNGSVWVFLGAFWRFLYFSSFSSPGIVFCCLVGDLGNMYVCRKVDLFWELGTCKRVE